MRLILDTDIYIFNNTPMYYYNRNNSDARDTVPTNRYIQIF